MDFYPLCLVFLISFGVFDCIESESWGRIGNSSRMGGEESKATADLDQVQVLDVDKERSQNEEKKSNSKTVLGREKQFIEKIPNDN